MIHRQVKFSPEDVENLKKFDASIEHWSVQHVKFLIQADDIKGTVRGIYIARQRLFEKTYKEAGIDPATVNHAELMEDGILNILCQESPTSDDSKDAEPTPQAVQS